MYSGFVYLFWLWTERTRFVLVVQRRGRNFFCGTMDAQRSSQNKTCVALSRKERLCVRRILGSREATVDRIRNDSTLLAILQKAPRVTSIRLDDDAGTSSTHS